MSTRSSYRHEALTRRILGAFYDVYNELGHGYVESVYEAAMYIALAQANLRVDRQAHVDVRYKGHRVGRYRVDLMVEDALILELKAQRKLEPVHEAQLLNLLRATRLEGGLLLNFGPSPHVKRLAYSNARKRSANPGLTLPR